jgi:hypothetical protein
VDNTLGRKLLLSPSLPLVRARPHTERVCLEDRRQRCTLEGRGFAGVVGLLDFALAAGENVSVTAVSVMPGCEKYVADEVELAQPVVR